MHAVPSIRINTGSAYDHDVSPISSPAMSRVTSRRSSVSAISVELSPPTSPVFTSIHKHETGSGGSPNSTMPTSDTATTASFDNSCQFDADDWFGRFREDLDVSDECPDRGTLAAAGEVPLYDQNGNMRPFRTFFQGLDAIGDRQLIIFIRHFYCGACQGYLRAMSEQITMQAYYTMPVPTSIVVIGCGNPALIPHYKAASNCPFPVFAEPSRKLYRILGMSMSLNIGMKRPEYMSVSPPAWVIEQLRQMAKTRGLKKFKGGHWLQIGGEFLFQDGQVVWCHRMRNYRDHAGVPLIKRILEIED